jgi:RNA polymerase sigma-70 factor
MVLEELARLIATGYAEGRMTFGELELGLGTYAARIKAIVIKNLGPEASDDAIVRFAKNLHYKDLYLAIACAQEGIGLSNHAHSGRGCSSAAWQVLETKYKVFINDLARFFSHYDSATDDIAENMAAELFLPDRSGNSRIMSYDGRSSLCTWLRVVVSNRAINKLRSPDSRVKELSSDVPNKHVVDSVDQAMTANRYGRHLSDAISETCFHLTKSERLLLLWRYADGLPLGRIATLLGIHQSNVTRRLKHIYSKLQKGIVRRLSCNRSLSDDALRECLEWLLDDPSSFGTPILDLIATGTRETRP